MEVRARGVVVIGSLFVNKQDRLPAALMDVESDILGSINILLP